MFFGKKACEACRIKDEKIRELESKLRISTQQLDAFLNNASEVSDKQKSDNFYFDRSLNWYNMELAEIERVIKEIYGRHGRTEDSISAVNELQFIQQEIKRNKQKQEIKLEGKPEPNKISKSLINKSIKYIVNKKKSSFCKIVQNGTTDWTSGNVSKDDEAQIMSLIGKNAHSFLTYHSNELPPEIDRKTFGSLLKTDKRSFAQFVKSELPKVLMEVKKELLQAEKVDLQLAEKKELKRTLWEQHKLEILGVLNEHKPKLLSNLRKSYQIDDYGTIKKDDRNEEIHRFLTSVKLVQKSRKIGLSKVQGYIKTWATNEIKKTSISTPLPENGIDFEYWVADRLREYDWEAQVTQGSGDQGVDVIAGQGNLRIAVQCKLYQGSVGNKAVQETLSGMLFLDLDRGIVISTGKYTRSARELANKNKILLLSPEDIPYMVDLLQK